MAWTDVIYYRSQNDINWRNSIAFFNLSDWNRINDDTDFCHDLLSTNLGYDVSLISLTPPTITTIPTVDSINNLIENIERLRIAAAMPDGMGLTTVLKYDWKAGANEAAPEYGHVNIWEGTLGYLHQWLPNAGYYAIHCGVANAGQQRQWQSRFRGSL